ncbi:S24 family peptidase [Caballeronia sp. LZ001]|uniref:S24 family peptidase n=1 Tax=Caballeronia sp. LZ001 TaxID=3038553 RepID=UPI002865328F|nr:S24 family peptidase [Caballeronia sp. LZ001]MDR5800666.1 S24 family peptidase [Caballeronia sp. LZ001]
MNKFERRRLRLIEIRDRFCGGTATGLAKKLGKSDSYVTRMLWPEDRKGRKRIGEAMVDQIEEAFGWKRGTFDSEQLPGGTGAASKDDRRETARLEWGSQTFAKDSKLVERNVEAGPDIRGKVPLISWVQAGAWESFVDDLAVGDAEDWLLSPIATSKNAYFLRVKGLSMFNPTGEPSFNENDLILVEPQCCAHSGSLVVVRLDDESEATFKQLVLEGGKQYLRALNPDWPTRIIEVHNNATICGVVKSKVVRY